jgi:copper(I)-binding protein
VSSSLRRGALAAAAIVVSVAPLSACGAGNDAQTLEVKPDNAATSVGDIKIQNATVVTQPDRTAKGPAVVTARIFNNGDRDETLTAITLPDAKAKAKLHPAGKAAGKIVVPAGGSVLLGGGGNASAVVADGREAAKDGDAQRVVFDLSSTGDVPITAFVVPATSYFKGWGPSELPTPAPSATRGGTPSGTPGRTTQPSGKPSGEPSGSASNKPGGGENNGIAPGEPTPND